jgi:hypothetical protein
MRAHLINCSALIALVALTQALEDEASTYVPEREYRPDPTTTSDLERQNTLAFILSIPIKEWIS